MRPAVLVLALAAFVWGQTQPNMPADFSAAGVAWNQYATPQINGWATFAHQIRRGSGFYSFTTEDVTAVQHTKPLRLQLSLRTGFAVYLRNFGPVAVFGLGDAGMATAGDAEGTNLGSAFSGGGMAAIQLGRGWTLIFPIRILKTALSDKQYAFEIGLGWGK